MNDAFGTGSLSKTPKATSSGGAGSRVVSPSTPSVHNIDPGKISRTLTLCQFPVADLVIQLNTSGYILHYLVCRKPLILASPVFAKMLETNSTLCSVKRWIDSEGESRDLLNIFDDNAEAMLVFLAVLHFKHEYVPSAIKEFGHLVALADLCDKYDCPSAFDQLRDRWLNPWATRSLDPYEHRDWLFVCAVFGEKRNFTLLARELIKTVSLGTREEGLAISFNDVAQHRLSEKMVDFIILKRADALGRLVKIFVDMRACLDGKSVDEDEHYQSISTGKTYHCDNELCMGSGYGCLIRKAQSNQKYFDTSHGATLSDTLEISVADFANYLRGCLTSMATGTEKVKPALHGGRYYDSSCGLGNFASDFLREIDRVENDIPKLIPSKFMRYSPKNGEWTDIYSELPDIESDSESSETSSEETNPVRVN